MKLSIPYIAGLIDGDGSFQLQIKFRDRKNKTFQINPRVQIGFKYLLKEEKLLYQIQKYFNAGKIYISNKDDKEKAVIRFWTTNLADTIKVCEEIIPYLVLKKEQAKKLLSVCKLMRSKKSKRYCKGLTTTSFDIYSKDEMLKIVDIATTMNVGMQTNRFRKARGRDTQYYINQLRQIYD